MFCSRPKASLSVLLLLAGVLAACGGSGDVPTAAGSPPGDTVPPESSAGTSSEPVTSETARAPGDDSLGAQLEDPSRYYGVYASPEQPNRQWFIAEAKRPVWAEQAPEVPPGHLALGAMFGDVAQWHLRTVSDTEFVQAEESDQQAEKVAVKFELGSDGRATAFRFTNGSYASFGRLERQGDLPEGWE